MIQHVLQRFCEWEHLGTHIDAHGSRLIAHTPRDYPEAYLHAFFAPVAAECWNGYGISLPGQLQALYSQCNGLSLFAHSISIYGIRAHYDRDLSALFQPFDLATHHAECVETYHAGCEARFEEPTFFGGYSHDGSHVLTTPYSPKVYRVLRGNTVAVNEWPDLHSFLTVEYDRLDRLFTRIGYLRDKGLATTPDKDRR